MKESERNLEPTQCNVSNNVPEIFVPEIFLDRSAVPLAAFLISTSSG